MKLWKIILLLAVYIWLTTWVFSKAGVIESMPLRLGGAMLIVGFEVFSLGCLYLMIRRLIDFYRDA